MAKPAKRRVDGGPGGASTRSEGIDSKRVTPPKAAGRQPGGGRYTPPTRSATRGPSPRWVPITMFALWIGGLLVIILNYMELLPGTEGGGNGWYLVGGLTAILLGIVVSTRYH